MNYNSKSVKFVIYPVLSCQFRLTAARLKKCTAQRFRLANSARIFINLGWYDYTKTC